MSEVPPAPGQHAQTGLIPRIHRLTVLILQVILVVELVLVLRDGQWLNAFLLLMIMGGTLLPSLLRQWRTVDIPLEFQVLTIAFVFAAVFLGEIRSYYERFWWWDIALHVSSGLLLGIFGFLLVYVLNESDRIELHMRPRFVAIFAFFFAVSVGAAWEMFEFGMDSIFGTNMQKPMLGDPSGLKDTMWDLIVDAAGALVICTLGWFYMRQGKRSFIERWIHKFIRRNPHLFRS